MSETTPEAQTNSLDEVRRRIEVLHGNLVAQRTTENVPTGTEDTIQSAILAGRLIGLQSALKAFDSDPTLDRPREEKDAYRALSHQFQTTNDVVDSSSDRREAGGFQ